MTSNGRTIYIAGAGIAGLTLALALAKFGATVVVLERHKSVMELGAGIQLSPNARRVLNRLGLDKQITAKSLEPAGIDVYPYRATKPLVTLALGQSVRERYGVPYSVMHRGDLAELLHRACRRFANIDIAFDVRSFDAASHARGVTVTADTGTTESRTGRAFALVGADGVNSETRTRIIGGPAAIYSGSVAWRASLDAAALDGVLALDRTSLLFAPGYHAVCYPIPHRKKINVALFSKERAVRAFGGNPPKEPTLPWAVLRSSQFDAILAAGRGRWGYWPVATVSAPKWHEGGIGLIGDAAHAMLPFQAQGAAMAIEDAAILAPLLMTEPSAELAFMRFTKMRQDRIARVARISASNGRIFHMEWPLTVARDLVIAARGGEGHLPRLDWLYGFDTAPEAEIAAPVRA
jgi:salicylate hydroxylase